MVLSMTLNYLHFIVSLLLSHSQMSKQVALGLLSVTNTGSEILSVLDVIQSSIADADNDRGQDSAFMDDAFGG